MNLPDNAAAGRADSGIGAICRIPGRRVRFGRAGVRRVCERPTRIPRRRRARPSSRRRLAARRCTRGAPTRRVQSGENSARFLSCAPARQERPARPCTDCLIIPARSGSPFTSRTGPPCACPKPMCGGRGGTSGSMMNSSSIGRSARSARPHAPPIASGSSIRSPASPSDFASSAYGKSGRICAVLLADGPRDRAARRLALVAAQPPTSPVNFACAQAANAASSSCRVWMKRISSASWFSVPISPLIPPPGYL